MANVHSGDIEHIQIDKTLLGKLSSDTVSDGKNSV